MAESQIIKFGSDHYDYDYKKNPLENWKLKREYYFEKKGMDIGDFPVMTEEEEGELAKQLKNIR